jgi:hypothetical protein
MEPSMTEDNEKPNSSPGENPIPSGDAPVPSGHEPMPSGKGHIHTHKAPILLNPWLVAVAALVLYGLTLNHWVTFASLPFASQLTGWDWHPGPLPWRPTPQHPLFFIFTFPLRLLPVGWRVVGLNVFNAVCAALTLAILARSVRLLSHDRTKEQRLRKAVKHAFLSVRTAFLPAAFAVLLLAAQLTFWENAVSGTGEMLDLLVFAFLILCLLEYRISPGERRLNLFTFVYGLGVANNWALIGFFPCFLLALIWIKRGELFKWKFALRLAGWGALGLLLYGLAPLLGALHHDGSFWKLLRQKFTEQHLYLTMPGYFAAIAAVPTLIPLFFAAIYWPSHDGEINRTLQNLSRLMFRALHILFLAIGVFMFFDVKYSPSPRARFGLGLMGGPGFLTFYYLAALSVGYFSGYVLLVFGKEIVYHWRRNTGMSHAFNRAVVGLLWAAAFGLPAALFYENFPRIRDMNSRAVAKFGEEMAMALPAKPAIVMADDPARLYLAMGAAQSLGLPDQYTYIESRDLIHRDYLRYLADRSSLVRAEFTNLDSLPEIIPGQRIGVFLAHLSAQEPVYYLHFSVGSYFERVCMTPHRLGGYLHPYPTNALEELVLTPAEIATNQACWTALEKESLASLPELAKGSADAMRLSRYYSEMSDYWGTELQKAATRLNLTPDQKGAMLTNAGDQFREALRLNPSNLMARVNQEYNAQLRGMPSPGALASLSNVVAEFRGHWDIALIQFGPADVPDLDIQIGGFFAEHGLFLQAAHLFQRGLELAPHHPRGELDLAGAYVEMGLENAGLNLIKDIRTRSTYNPLEMTLLEALAYAKKNDLAQADKLLADELKKNPKDDKTTGMIAEFDRRMGYSLLRESQANPALEKSAEKDAAAWFQKALTTFNEQLQLLNASKANAQEISNINLRKTEIQQTLKDSLNH